MIGARIASLVVGAALPLAVASVAYGRGPAFGGRLAAAQAPTSHEFTFIGNAAWAITDGKTTLYTDFPYQPGAFGYMSYDFSAIPKVSGALCLVTHAHLDHFDPTLFSRMDARLIAPAPPAGVPADRVIPFAPKMSYRDIEIEAFRTPHGDVAHASYIVTWHGRRLYFTGDTDDTKALEAARDLDVAFVSPWLLEAVRKKNGRIDARKIVVYHHRSDETVGPFPNREVPRQGETFSLP